MAPKTVANEEEATDGSAPTAMNFRDPVLFERTIFLKQNAAWLLEQELKRIDPAMEIALGTATDPYQPIERRGQNNRRPLEVFVGKTGDRVGVVAKTRLIGGGIELPGEISPRDNPGVHMAQMTPEAK